MEAVTNANTNRQELTKTGKRIVKEFAFEKPDRENKQLETVRVEIGLERVAGGYEFSVGDERVQVASIELDDLDAKAVAQQLGLPCPKEPDEEVSKAEAFIHKLALYLRLPQSSKTVVPDVLGKEVIEVWRKQNLQDYVLKDLDKRVKRDRSTKLSVFYTGLSAYLKEPMNLFLKGPSGSGKTYNSVETVRYFPKDDVMFLGGLSPKALIHDYGVLLSKDGKEIDLDAKPVKPRKADFKKAAEHGLDPEEEFSNALSRYKEDIKEWREKLQNSYRLIDLSHKILIFLEAPDFNTYRMLLPILSHDTYEITYKFTDKTAQGSLRTIKVVIRGWPATIFLTTDRSYMEELATRSFTVTPETSTDKIKEVNELTNAKDCYPWQYSGKTEETNIIEQLVTSIRKQLAPDTKDEMDVVVPFTTVHDLFPWEIVRDMRDFAHFMQFLKTVTALHFYQRPFMKKGDKQYLMSTVEDVWRAVEVYKELFETTRTGTEQRILDFYHETVSKIELIPQVTRPTPKQGQESEKTETQQTLSPRTKWYLKELTTKYNETNRRKLSSDSVRKMLDRLSVIGYVDVEPDSKDKRLNLYGPLLNEQKAENHREFENPLVLESKLKKGFEEWKQNKGIDTSFYYYKNNLPDKEDTWNEQEISLDEAEKIILTCEPGVFPLISETDSGQKKGKKPKIAGTGETQQSSANSTRPALGEMLQALRERFPHRFVEVEFVNCVEKSHWTQEEGEALLQQLEKEGQIFKNAEGAWMWA